MRTSHAVALAALISALPVAAHAQRAGDLPPIDVKQVVGDIGPGWVKKQSGEEGVTYVCETDACGGRGVVGIGQARPTADYLKAVTADPEKGLASYRYATDESTKPSGCSFKDYEVRRLGERRVQYESKGSCAAGGTAAMATIFDADRGGMLSVQVLTGSETEALKLRDASLTKIAAALDGAVADGRQ
ncbi:hypothetical protein [Methylopila sp. M107]|uniref:hypothetical protein n=1 Tax=Methylopila sp. M107 TaxID=1101190 RepID=UPI00035E46A8|nr:hypothetical protein [Methylopila sp. M107]